MSQVQTSPTDDLDLLRKEKQKKSLEKTYLINALLLLPAMILVIPYAACSWRSPLFPALVLIPMGFGSIFSFYRVYLLRYKRKVQDYQILLPESEADGRGLIDAYSKVLESVANLAFATGILALLIPTWIFADDYRSLAWLAAYSTVPMIMAMVNHAVLAVKTLPHTTFKRPFAKKEPVCARCNNTLQTAEADSPKASAAGGLSAI